MNCKQCGAPLKVEENQNIFRCDYCGSYDFPNPNLDGIALLDEISPYACPICSKPLVAATIENVRIFSCPICRGNLINQSKMLSILRLASTDDTICEDQPHHPDLSELQRKLICPACHKTMDDYPYGGPGNIIIQGCSHCGLIWLDFGEVSSILRALAQMYQHNPDEPGQKIQSVKF
jgi:Zn-finger nucleic acid-binding protein